MARTGLVRDPPNLEGRGARLPFPMAELRSRAAWGLQMWAGELSDRLPSAITARLPADRPASRSRHTLVHRVLARLTPGTSSASRTQAGATRGTAHGSGGRREKQDCHLRSHTALGLVPDPALTTYAPPVHGGMSYLTPEGPVSSPEEAVSQGEETKTPDAQKPHVFTCGCQKQPMRTPTPAHCPSRGSNRERAPSLPLGGRAGQLGSRPTEDTVLWLGDEARSCHPRKPPSEGLP